MKKKTKKKIIEIIIKTGLVLSMLSMIVPVLLIFISLFGGYTLPKLYDLCPKIFIVIAIPTLILLFKYPDVIERVKVKAFEFPLNINNFEDFIKYLDNNIEKIGYKKYQYFSGNKELKCIYYRHKRDILEYFSVYHFEEIKDTKTKTFSYSDDLMEDFFNSYYQDKKRNDFFRDTFIIWVDKESKSFTDIVNTNLDQGEYDGLLIVGVSPSKGRIYVANQKEGNNKFLYWELRKKFLKVMNLRMKDRIKNK